MNYQLIRKFLFNTVSVALNNSASIFCDCVPSTKLDLDPFGDKGEHVMLSI